tara:strand:- start:526 stop:1341 length:816 start_codon:yes stop_codon:yes gene_type:complete
MNKKRMYNLFLVSLVVIVYLLVTLGLFIYQRSLLYHPVENNYYGDKLTVEVKKIQIPTQDNIKLLAWYHKKDIKKYKTILYLHGNAGSLENRIHKINHFNDMDINFLLLAWRGFSGNEGKPTEQGLYIDARSAVSWLINEGVKEENIIIYGESLGTGVAAEIAQNKKFAGVILESPFTSMIAAAKSKYPIFPIKLLLKDKYESDKKIKNIKSPILIMHGEIDKIVPFWMGKKMFEIANEPKYSYFSKYDDHMLEFNKDLLNSIKSFVNSLN